MIFFLELNSFINIKLIQKALLPEINIKQNSSKKHGRTRSDHSPSRNLSVQEGRHDWPATVRMLLTKCLIIFWLNTTLVRTFFIPPTWWFDVDFLRFPFLHQTLSRRLTTSEKETTFTSGTGHGDHQKTINIQQNICNLRYHKYQSMCLQEEERIVIWQLH